MRNAFVVLASLCIGLASGFIIPSSVSEATTVKDSINENTVEPTEEVKSTKLSKKVAILPESRNNIDEKDLYEHASEKQNNQNERAFIYINQKFKKPIRNKIFRILPMDKPDLIHRLVTAPATQATPLKTYCPPSLGTFDAPSNINSYFHVYDYPEKQPQETSSYFAAPVIFRCNLNAESKKHKDNTKPTLPQINRMDERREYFELLKPPILRPANRLSNKLTYIASSLSPSSISYKDNYIKNHNSRNQYVNKQKVSVGRPDDTRKNYGFESAFVRRPPYEIKEITRTEDINFEGDFINDDDSRRLYENNQEEDKLLDKYLKDTLEEQIPSNNDKVVANTPVVSECSYRECVLQASNKYTNNGLLVRPECKCGRRLNIKQMDPFLVKDRPSRDKTTHNETVPKSSELNYYEEMLSDDSTLNKQEDEIVRPPVKLNETAA